MNMEKESYESTSNYKCGQIKQVCIDFQLKCIFVLNNTDIYYFMIILCMSIQFHHKLQTRHPSLFYGDNAEDFIKALLHTLHKVQNMAYIFPNSNV